MSVSDYSESQIEAIKAWADGFPTESREPSGKWQEYTKNYIPHWKIDFRIKVAKASIDWDSVSAQYTRLYNYPGWGYLLTVPEEKLEDIGILYRKIPANAFSSFVSSPLSGPESQVNRGDKKHLVGKRILKPNRKLIHAWLEGANVFIVTNNGLMPIKDPTWSPEFTYIIDYEKPSIDWNSIAWEFRYLFKNGKKYFLTADHPEWNPQLGEWDIAKMVPLVEVGSFLKSFKGTKTEPGYGLTKRPE